MLTRCLCDYVTVLGYKIGEENKPKMSEEQAAAWRLYAVIFIVKSESKRSPNVTLIWRTYPVNNVATVPRGSLHFV